MLSLIGIKKDYYVGEQVVHALNGVTVNFRKNEFVSILGQSGCGKTTLMNVVGGLDRATEGDIVLDGVSTKGYKETDWDDYRNQKIGFVFQNYNLIPHLNVLTNVELALTISGVEKEERERRAKRALDRVGLVDHYNKRPNQLSGGQMQRVAIARAIVNEPDILLADEPTGAIDSETSVQIMEILKEISAYKLVIMVTHNAELAEQYSTRIIKILDGEIISDDNPFYDVEPSVAMEDDTTLPQEIEPVVTQESAEPAMPENVSYEYDANPITDDLTDENEQIKPETCEINADTVDEIPIAPKGKRKRKKGATMSFWTSVKLSFRNLVNKRGRSIMTAVAGSIGIISIALILAVNNGFNVYIDNFEQQSMAKYPVTISSGEYSVLNTFEEFLGGDELTGDSMDLDSILGIFAGDESEREKFSDDELVYVYGRFSGMFKEMMNRMSKEKDISVFKKHLEEKFDYSLGAVRYDYSINMNIYRKPAEDKPYRQINPLSESDALAALLALVSGDSEEEDGAAEINSALNTFAFWDEIIAEDNVIDSQYSVLAGHLPKNMNEIVLVLDDYNQITDFDMLLLDEMGLSGLMAAMANSAKLDEYTKTFDEILSKEYFILPTGAAYVYNPVNQLYTNVKEVGGTALASAIETGGIKVKVSGIIRTKEGVDGGCIKGVIGYPSSLGDYIIKDANESAYVAAQRAAYDAYMEIINAAAPVQQKILDGTRVRDLTPEERALYSAALLAELKDVSTGEKMEVTAYDSTLKSLNVRDLEKPSYIYIYPYAIGNKNKITSFIDEFNTYHTAQEEEAEALAKENGTPKPTATCVVEYKDDLDSIVSELNGLVSTITYILIAVALVSVLVTMLLIAIIMYISVQDRTREIGILRSLGARRLDISNIFNVETMLLGIASGIIGILLTLVLQFPANAIFKATLGIEGLLKIAWWHPIVLIFGAVFITVISGLIPAMMASKKDPVNALRTE